MVSKEHDIERQIRTLRPGDEVLLERLSDLAGTLPELQDRIKAIHGRRAIIRETSTGRTSNGPEASDMMLEAAADVKKGPGRRASQKNGAKGGRPHTVRSMPYEEAQLNWKDVVAHRTDADAIDAMPGWNKTAAYKAFGRSGRSKVGRPKKKQD